MPIIDHCSTLEIRLYELQEQPLQLPVEAILNWLHRKCDGTNENPKELFLRIYAYNIENIGDLYDYLKKVIKIVYLQNFI